MPLTFTEVDVSGASYLGDSAVQNRVVYQTGYTGLWLKKVSNVWVAYTAQPSGKLAAKDFVPLVDTPYPADTVYNPCMGTTPIQYSGTSDNVELYFDTTDSKFKCGRPGDRA